MHLLLTAIGSYGDVHPMIGVAASMRERGHKVTLITNPYFAAEAEAAGVPHEPVCSVEEYHDVTGHADIWHKRRSVSLVFRWAAERLLRPIYDRIEALYQPGETLIAAHPLDISSRVARESLGAPVVSVFFAPMNLWSDHRPAQLSGAPVGPGWPRWWNRGWLWLGEQLVMRRHVRPPLNAFRRELGLPAVGRIFPDWWFSTGHALGLFPEWFLGPGGAPNDWPDGAATAGFLLWDGAAGRQPPPVDAELDTWLGTHAEQKPIVFTPGSANRAASTFFRHAVGACRELDRPALLLTKFPEQVPSPLPPSVRHEAFVPLSRVLPRAAAFVHHGGIGSCAQALAAGVPQLIHPLAYDQPDNARRLEMLGVGAALRPRDFNDHSAAAAIRRLLDSPSVREQCRLAAARCDGAAARRQACEYLERVAAESDIR